MSHYPFLQLFRDYLTDVFELCFVPLLLPRSITASAAPSPSNGNRRKSGQTGGVVEGLTVPLEWILSSFVYDTPLPEPGCTLRIPSPLNYRADLRPVASLRMMMRTKTTMTGKDEDPRVGLRTPKKTIEYARQVPPLSALPHVDDACLETLFKTLNGENVLTILTGQESDLI